MIPDPRWQAKVLARKPRASGDDPAQHLVPADAAQ